MHAWLIALVLAVSGQAAAAPRIVQLKAADGVALEATYYAAARPGPGILLLHQCNRERSTWASLATAAASRGYHVLALDFRGYGESGGERFQKFQEQQPVVDGKWPGDVDAAFAWLVAQPGVDRTRIAAAGASCGVNQSVQLARRHPEVRTVVLLSGGVNPAGREYLRSSPALSILAAGSQDDGDAIPTMRWILGWSRHQGNRMLEYKAAGHGTDMFAVENGLQPAILDWFDTRLRNAPTETAASSPGKPTVVEEFWDALRAPGGIPRAREMYRDVARRSPDVVLFPETELNLYGYELLQGGNAKDAAEVFELNVEAYPRSANTYDSLSDAYVALGRREAALQNAEKALALLATDTSAPAEFKDAVRASAEKKVAELRKQH